MMNIDLFKENTLTVPIWVYAVTIAALLLIFILIYWIIGLTFKRAKNEKEQNDEKSNKNFIKKNNLYIENEIKNLILKTRKSFTEFEENSEVKISDIKKELKSDLDNIMNSNEYKNYLVNIESNTYIDFLEEANKLSPTVWIKKLNTQMEEIIIIKK